VLIPCDLGRQRIDLSAGRLVSVMQFQHDTQADGRCQLDRKRGV
jgi:hypothetical protein